MSNEQFPWDDLDDVDMSGLQGGPELENPPTLDTECIANLSQRAAVLVEENRVLHSLLTQLVNTARSREEIEVDYLKMFDGDLDIKEIAPGTAIALRLIEKLAHYWNHDYAPAPSALFNAIFQYAHAGLGECENEHRLWFNNMMEHYKAALDGELWEWPT